MTAKTRPASLDMVHGFSRVLKLGLGHSKHSNEALPERNLEGIARFITEGKARRIICMVGAGVSDSAGVPDFYKLGGRIGPNSQQYGLPYPEAVFELDYFKAHPQPFHQVAKELFPGRFVPTPTHCFLRLLHQKGLLLRCYTQNIDSLEAQAGLPKDKVVAAHGNFDGASCIECGKHHTIEHVKAAVMSGQICRCKRCKGLVKPDIAFVGEELPKKFFQKRVVDFPKCDLLLILGSSLVDQPFNMLINAVGGWVPRVLVHTEPVGQRVPIDPLNFSLAADRPRDTYLPGTCDSTIKKLATLLGWEHELDELVRTIGLTLSASVAAVPSSAAAAHARSAAAAAASSVGRVSTSSTHSNPNHNPRSTAPVVPSHSQFSTTSSKAGAPVAAVSSQRSAGTTASVTTTDSDSIVPPSPFLPPKKTPANPPANQPRRHSLGSNASRNTANSTSPPPSNNSSNYTPSRSTATRHSIGHSPLPASNIPPPPNKAPPPTITSRLSPSRLSPSRRRKAEWSVSGIPSPPPSAKPPSRAASPARRRRENERAASAIPQPPSRITPANSAQSAKSTPSNRPGSASRNRPGSASRSNKVDAATSATPPPGVAMTSNPLYDLNGLPRGAKGQEPPYPAPGSGPYAGNGPGASPRFGCMAFGCFSR